MVAKVGKLFTKMTMRDVPLDGKTVLVRADYNVPLNSDGSISSDFRLQASLPTLRKLLERRCKIVIISHLGRPEGRDEKFSLRIIAERLAELLDMPVNFVPDTVGDLVKMRIKRTSNQSVTLLENLRFYAEEEANDLDFAKRMARDTGAKYFVQDGFGVVHRAHASTSAIAQVLPGVAGLLLEKEIMMIRGAMQNPKRPLLAILGGAKVSDKIPVVNALIDVADQIVIGGAMANTFLATDGVTVGKSKIEPEEFDTVRKIHEHVLQRVGESAARNYLIIPSDVAVASEISPKSRRKIVKIDDMSSDDIALDIGDQTIERYARAIDRAQTVIWNGTMGMAEIDAFAHGSARLALEIAERKGKLVSIIGGGDTADFVLGWDARGGASFSHVSTGGGASLELMAGDKLPGVDALLDGRR